MGPARRGPHVSNWLERMWYPAQEERAAERILRSPLTLAAATFGGVAAARRALYRGGVLRTHRTRHAPVISVGNLNVGGSGKTPCVMALAARLSSRGLKVAVLSRGYGRTVKAPRILQGGAPEAIADEVGDEPLLIARRCPEVLVLVGADRVANARVAEDVHGAQVILLDDGMQHLRLARDLEVVVIDASVGLGNGRLLPRGPLREPPTSLASADLFWLRNGPPPRLQLPERPRVIARDLASGLRIEGRREACSVLAGARVWAFAGIARPGRFTRTLEGLGAHVVEATGFGDHHRYSPAELSELAQRARAAGLQLVTTEKDAVRLPAGFPSWVLELSVELTAGEEALDQALDAVLDGRGMPRAALSSGL